jgi:protein XagA
MRTLRTFLLLLAAISYSTLAHADGWPQPKGYGFFKLDYSAIFARKFFGADGNLYNINGVGTQLGAHTVAFYGEYGITNKLTVIAYAPLLVRNTVNEGVGSITGEILQPGLSNTNVGDADVALRYGLLKKNRWVVSASLWAGLPLGDSDNPDLLYTGDGEFNQQIRAEWGYGANRWYASGFLGVNNRTKGFSEEFRYSAEAGYWLVKQRLLATVRFMGVQSFNNGDPTNSGNGLFSNNVSFASPQIALAYEHKGRWGVQVQAAGAVSGRNALAAPALSIGVYTKKLK